MRRREFIAATAALLVSPRRSPAQGTRRRVGFLAMDVVEPTVQKLCLEGLRNHGWIYGTKLIVDDRLAPSHDRLPCFPASLVALNTDSLFGPHDMHSPTRLGVALPIVAATSAGELDIAFASAAAQRADGMIVFGDPFHFNNAPRVTALAAEHRLPAIYISRLFATSGGLISYGSDIPDLFFRAGGYVDRILKSTKPSDLPVEQPTKFEMVINMKAAKALGLIVPPSLLVRADEVIE